MALMPQFCACCRITVPQYGHRALAFTSSGAPQHSKQSKNFLQSGILSPIFSIRDIRFPLYILRPRMARAISLSAARLSTKQPRPVHARTGLLFSMYLSVPYIFPCLRRRERQSAIMAINSLFVGLPLMPIKIAYSCSSFNKVLIKILPICSHYSTRKMMPSYFNQYQNIRNSRFRDEIGCF